jgi:hypothetical protein
MPGRVILSASNAPQRAPEYTDMASTFIAMLHYSQDLDAWLHLTGWDSPPNDRDTMAALRQIESQTDEVVAERGEPAFTPFVLLGGTLDSAQSPHEVRKVWRLAPDLADRLLQQIEQRGTEEAIDDAIAEWDGTREEHGDDALSLDLDDYIGVDLADLADRAYAPHD